MTQAAIRRGRQTNRTNSPVVSDRTTGNRRNHRLKCSLLIRQHNKNNNIINITHLVARFFLLQSTDCGDNRFRFDVRRHPVYTDQPERVHGASSPDACTVGPYRLPWSSKAHRCPHFTKHRHISAVAPAYLYGTFELWDRHRPRSEINGQNTPHELLFPPLITAMATAVL